MWTCKRAWHSCCLCWSAFAAQPCCAVSHGIVWTYLNSDKTQLCHSLVTGDKTLSLLCHPCQWIVIEAQVQKRVLCTISTLPVIEILDTGILCLRCDRTANCYLFVHLGQLVVRGRMYSRYRDKSVYWLQGNPDSTVPWWELPALKGYITIGLQQLPQGYCPIPLPKQRLTPVASGIVPWWAVQFSCTIDTFLW